MFIGMMNNGRWQSIYMEMEPRRKSWSAVLRFRIISIFDSSGNSVTSLYINDDDLDSAR